MKVTIITLGDRKDVEISEEATVDELREKVAAKFSSTADRSMLIFMGKILKNGETLKALKIEDGQTLHLVIKNSSEAAQGTSTQATPSGSQSQSASTVLFGVDLGSGALVDIEREMHRQFMANPQMMQEMMDDPFIQELSTNPDLLRRIVLNNTHLRELMERNPSFVRLLNSPENYQRAAESLRIPAVQQGIRNYDETFGNLASSTSGLNTTDQPQDSSSNTTQSGDSSAASASNRSDDENQ